MPTKIVQREHPTLREKAKPVLQKDILSPRIKDIIERMKEALDSQDDGVAIAAPQIGESVRIFVLARRLFTDETLLGKEKNAQKNLGHEEYLVYINPKISKISKKKKFMEEGCLSIRYLYGKVARAEKATVEAKNEWGQPFTRGASGLLAQIFQHEIDHLDGILFTDTASDVREITPEELHGAQS